jgi:Mg2+ and Co2+ transporter CorA
VAALTIAIEAAKTNLVMDRIIQRANKQLEWLTYCKQLEAMLATAVAEGVKENLAAIIERIEKEAITIEPKTLSDAKGRLAKMK